MVILGPFMLHKPMKVTVVYLLLCMYNTELPMPVRPTLNEGWVWPWKRDVELSKAAKVLCRDKNS